MTLSEIAAYVCAKAGPNDTSSLAICATFVNARYRMIYDKEDWTDAMISASVATVPGTATYSIPAGIERIKTLQRSAGVIIEPSNYTFLAESYPELLTGSGSPRFYEEFTGAGTDRGFQLYPIPVAVESLMVYGKRVFVPLTDSATPILRNIDNALIAFAYYDMLQRMRQHGKAKDVVLPEAAAALQLMTDVEKARANRPRQSRNTTIAGDSLEEMTNAVSCRIGDYTPETRIMIHELMRRHYSTVYDSQLWPESKVVMELDRDGSEIVLPEYVDKVISVRQGASLSDLAASEESLLFEITPQIFEQIGSPIFFMRLAPVGVAVLPPINETLEFVSDNDSDVETLLTITGETKGVEVRETLTLGGLVPVRSAYPYDTPLVVAKGLTLGAVSVVGNTSRVFLVQLGADERERKHERLWMQPTPISTDTSKCLLLGKRKIRPLINEADTPIFSGMANLLIQMTVGDLLMKAGSKDGAADARSQASDALQVLLDRETKQAAFSQRATPSVEPSYCIY